MDLKGIIFIFIIKILCLYIICIHFFVRKLPHPNDPVMYLPKNRLEFRERVKRSPFKPKLQYIFRTIFQTSITIVSILYLKKSIYSKLN